MKNQINNQISTFNKLNEINLFRAMSSSLNKKSSSVFVKETHSWAGFVQYNSPSSSSPVIKEISDLMIISHNRKNKTTRLCFLQAKFHKKNITNPFLKFKGDYFQWELLYTRPLITSIRKSYFPQDILSFTTYKSISSFGVFYYDSSSKIDMLYSIPDLLKPYTIKTNKKLPSTTLIFPGMKNCPQNNCFVNLPNETISTCDIDMFEKLLLHGLIGAPINGMTTIEQYLFNAIKKIINEPEDDLLNVIINSFNSNIDYDSKFKDIEIPNMLFVLCNEEHQLG